MSLTRFSSTYSFVGPVAILTGTLLGALVCVEASAGPVTVSTGGEHSCAITPGGGVRCWGSNDYGQLGDGTTTSRSHPAPVIGLTGVVAVVAGSNHTCALTTGGGLKCWGSNDGGQLGDGTQLRRTTPVDVTGLTSGVAAVSAGFNFTCAVTTVGGVKCWGVNSNGELGIGSTVSMSLTPTDVAGLAGGATGAIASYNRHTCVSVSTGVRCWGVNGAGELGDGTTTNRLAPVVAVGVSTVTALAAGYNHTCALEASGGVKCWGYNGQGQVGDGTYTGKLTAVPVSGLTSGVVAIAAGGSHSCAISTGGTMRCWGYNYFGQLGNGTRNTTSVPAVVTHLAGATVTGIAAGAGHTCAVTNSWRVVCWGVNNDGQVGAGVAGAPVPTAVANLASGATAVGAGDRHACAVAGGGVKCWGFNINGELGDGTTTSRMAPVDVAGLTGVVRVSAGGMHTCALTAAGGLKCWGDNSDGELGDGTYFNRLAPVDVTGLSSGVQAFAVGLHHTCAITAAGGLKCWGSGSFGQLGDGTTAARAAPNDVPGLTSGVVAVAAGMYHTCAVTTAGAVRCWGWNLWGQLGDGSTTNRLSPVAVSGLTSGVATVFAGEHHTCALTASGSMSCWGDNGFGQLGDGTTTHRPTPVSVSGLTGGVVAVAGGVDHTCAVMATGALKCWGSNQMGQLGDPTVPYNRPLPADVPGLSAASAVATGESFTCAVTGGGVRCWGMNQVGQIGDGTGVEGMTPVFVPGFGATMDFSDDGQADIITRNRVTGQIGFWLMNGTSIAREDRIAGPQDPNWQIVAAGDFNGDGKSDLVWRNRATGENIIWFMNGTAYVAYARVRDVPDANWQIVAATDFDLDGKPDLLWRNQATGDNVIWLMNGTEYRSYVKLQTVADRSWTIIAADDFDGNNQPEIIWFNTSTRQIILWHMNGTAFASYEPVTYVNPGWEAVGSGDTNGDDRADILWHNPATGGNMIWRMDGANHLGSTFPPALNDAEWEVMRIMGVVRPGPGDFNLDGCADIVWRNVATGANRIWYMSGAALAWSRDVSMWSILSWRMTGVGDVDGDGKPDVLWREAATGELRVWMMNGVTVLSNSTVTTLDVKWDVAAVGDFNADGKADLVLRHADTGENVIWFMNGATRIGYTRFTNVADTSWKIVGAGDFNGDGQTDLVWRNAASGMNVVWLMNGATMSSYVVLQAVADANWKIASVGDFNGDGKPDLMWRNIGIGANTGRNIIWFMNGTSLASYAEIQSQTDLNWVAK